MNEEYCAKLGLYVLIVLCLIVMAVSSYKSAFINTSYFSDVYKASLPFAGERTDRFVGNGAYEAPSFWNLGSVEETNDLLQAAARDKVTETYTPKPTGIKEGYTPKYSGAKESYVASPHFAKPTDFSHIESFAGSGL